MADPFALLAILLNVVLPVLLIAGLGFLARRSLQIDPRPLTRLSLYVLVPALLFNSLMTTRMGGDEVVRIAVYALVLHASLVGLGIGASRAFAATRVEASALTLGIAFINAGNYGLPVTLFAFGQEGFERAIVFVTFESAIMASAAVFIAAGGRLPWRDAALAALRLPVLWTAAVALLLRLGGIELPLPVGRAVTVLSGATIPAVILLLGMQIAGMRLRRLGAPVGVACVGRLVVSPAIGLVLVGLLGPSPLTTKVLVLEAAMPTAVNATLLAAEFDAEPELVSTIALLTTALSVVSVTGWVAYLQSL